MLIQRFSRGGTYTLSRRDRTAGCLFDYSYAISDVSFCVEGGWDGRWEHSCFCIFFDILLHVLACSLCIQVNLIRKATCLESFNQSENSLPHVESLLLTGLSLFPKPSSTMIQVAFFPLFSYFLSVMQATKMQGWDPSWRYNYCDDPVWWNWERKT